MADRNSYLAYKRNTRHLIYWMIHASNSIIQSSQSACASDIAQHDIAQHDITQYIAQNDVAQNDVAQNDVAQNDVAQKDTAQSNIAQSDIAPNNITQSVNTTGQIKVSDLVPISELIAKHISPIPSTIFELFQSVIEARTAAHCLFQQIATEKPDPEIERSNKTHKCFIDNLTRAFQVLGGETWSSKQKHETEKVDEDVEEVIFSNRFSILQIHESDDEEKGEDSAQEGAEATRVGASSARTKKNSKGKGKKGKRGRKGKGKSKSAAKEPNLDNVPLESYRIIADESGTNTDYMMAVYSIVAQWISIRHHMQGTWRKVAYSGLNSAVAGTMSNVAISMIKQAQSTIFVDFPGQESYEAIMKTITFGNPETAQGTFRAELHEVNASTQNKTSVDIDVKEQYLVYAYRDLLDFVADFQKNRSGKPTKSMLSQIRNWDPNFNLQEATNEQRIEWRRSYTINWLYDLVNVFSEIVVHSISKGEKIVLETVDWSANGPWHGYRRLYGLNEFAGDITSLAMQKPNTDIRHRILPHHVFQLQCIVDSLSVSRGWSLHEMKGHVLIPPALGFRPMRDIDLFMDRKGERLGHGYCQAVGVLRQFFDRDTMLEGDPDRYKFQYKMMVDIGNEFGNFLGANRYKAVLTFPQSRFANTDPNGLWEYSPFLCGVGLVEALEIAYMFGAHLWDRMPEPMCIIHLHNMLVQKGHIREPIGLYGSLEELFATSFFKDGKSPKSDFAGAFEAVRRKESYHASSQRQAIWRQKAMTGALDLHKILAMEGNRFFIQKSILQLYRDANWITERIPDGALYFASALSLYRIGQTKRVTDPATGKEKLENTPIVERARAAGLNDEKLIKMSSMLRSSSLKHGTPEVVLTSVPGGHTIPSSSQKKDDDGSGTNKAFDSSELLNIILPDIRREIDGAWPYLGLNYLFMTVSIVILFDRFEEELQRRRNPLWVMAYEKSESKYLEQKRLSLTRLVLHHQDPECLKVMAEIFQDPSIAALQHIYWKDLHHFRKPEERDPLEDGGIGGQCTVM